MRDQVVSVILFFALLMAINAVFGGDPGPVDEYDCPATVDRGPTLSC